ncbi:MAG: RDD family protein [Rhodothermales bacterium]
MENVQIQTAQNVGIDFEVAGLGDRVIAALIDYFLLFCYLIGASILATQVTSMAVNVLLFLPYFFYFLVCELFLNGQSIGKKLRKLKVARLDGSQPTLGNYLLRWLLRFIDLDFSFGMVAIITVFVTGKGQRLGDLAAGTTVVKVTPRVSLRDTIFARLEENYTPTFYRVDALDDSDISTAKDVLNTLVIEKRSHTTRVLGTKIKTALEHKMGVSSDLPPVDFLRTVIKDYNFVKGKV